MAVAPTEAMMTAPPSQAVGPMASAPAPRVRPAMTAVQMGVRE